jgi:mRNA-degrading endonuclease toxin of MazEF toxin-antitoxin module
VRVARGGVYYAGLPEIGDKPVLVVSWDPVSNGMGSPIVCLITSTDRVRALDTHVLVDASDSGLEYDSYILCHELATLDAGDIRRHVGQVSVSTLVKVELALRRALDLP